MTEFQCNDAMLTREEIRALGIDDEDIKWALLHRDLVSRRRGVLEPPGVPDSPSRRQGAAVKAAGPCAVLSHFGAAGRHLMPAVEPGIVELSVRRLRAARLQGVVVHTAPDLQDVDIVIVDDVPCTTIARTIVDLAGLVDSKTLRRMLAFAERKQRPNGLDRVVAAADRVSVKRRPQVAPVVDLVHRLRSGEPGLDISPRCLAAFRRAGIREPILEFPVRWLGVPNICDAVFLPERVNVEFDDDETHATVLGTHSDKTRDRRAERCGWVVERVTQSDDVDAFAEHVSWVLRQRAVAS